MATAIETRHPYLKSLLAAVLVLLLFLCLATPAGRAAADVEEPRWSRVNIPAEGEVGGRVLADGSDIKTLIMAADGTLYTHADGLTYSLYKSSDGGKSWTSPGSVTDSIVDIATAPNDTETVYYATTAAVYRSGDGGQSFGQMGGNPGGAGSNNLEITTLDVAGPDGGNIIAAGTRDTDSGQYGGVYTLDEAEIILNWTDSGAGSYDVYAVAFSPNYNIDRQLTAVVSDETETRVLTRAGGTGWGAITGDAILGAGVAVGEGAVIAFPDNYDGSAESYLRFISIDTGGGNGDVYKITAVGAPDNSTATDLNVGDGYGQGNLDITGLAVRGTGANTELLAGAAGSSQTYFSNDGGESWLRSRRGPTGGSKTRVLMGTEAGGGEKTLYAATSGSESAFSVSGDEGRTWGQISLVDTGMSSIIDLAPSPNYSEDRTLFMLTFGGEYSLWRSGNGGGNWERILSSTAGNVDSLSRVEISPQYGQGSRVVFLAGDSHSRPAVWKSTDNGQNFTTRMTADPVTGSALTIGAWAVVDDDRLFIGSYDGSRGLVYLTEDGGLSYEVGAGAGYQALTSIVLSPDYGQDGNILAGNSNGWVYRSGDNGGTFRPLPPDAGAAPLTGSINVAFDADFSSNGTVYATSNGADKGVYRFIIGSQGDWESIDGTLPGGGTLGGVTVSSGGVLYSANSQADGGIERCLNPAYPLGPSFDTVIRGLNDGATLSGLWQRGTRLWSIDTTGPRLMTFRDGLTATVRLISPPDNAAGIGALINDMVSNISLDWSAVDGATSYQWQLDYDTDFSSVPSGFEGNTRASSARLPTLTPSTRYYWQVRATLPVPGPWSEERSFTTTLDTGSPALGLQSPKAGADGIRLQPLFQWSAVPGADAYELLVATDADFTNPLIIKTGDYALSTNAWQSSVILDHATIYYWKVRAINSDTYSDWSAVGAFATEVKITPPPPPVTLPPAMSTLPTPTAVSPPLVIQPVMPVPPLLPPPPLTQIQMAPDWPMYVIGALLLTIVLLVAAVMVLAMGISRRQGQ